MSNDCQTALTQLEGAIAVLVVVVNALGVAVVVATRRRNNSHHE